MLLEDAECLNAGYGSNLTQDGEVECDASIITGNDTAFGSVGAVSGIQNPIRLARAILDYSLKPDPLGRIPPMMLVSSGALSFARSQNLDPVSPHQLISPRARKEWERWSLELTNAKMEMPHDTTGIDAANTYSPEHRTERISIHALQDTVGAIAWSTGGAPCAGVSSGGLLLKSSGRVGEPYMEQVVGPSGTTASQSVAWRAVYLVVINALVGAGEYIIQAALARSLSDALGSSSEGDTHEIIQQVLDQYVHVDRRPDVNTIPDIGMLVFTEEESLDGYATPRLWCAFTTESMAVAYASSIDSKPKVKLLHEVTYALTEP
ncbi:uncharacterized protein FIBRA_03541 [Fibroporia radiculosa]|uniref:Asparaginase n=1 Tax=Fibroporia radiculosa TaxID=599839 RepID=J4HW18_9APHY|nr:uncharacterized protein FIBRA_03541 [Fibroporia radiculosa]CCM01487.1 predicted protein [Fibroporia radiculosa]